MKKKLKNYGIYLAFVGVIFLAIYFADYAGTHYLKKAEVVTVVSNSVCVEDENGDRWTFYGKNYKRGDKVKIIMYNNHTDLYIYDDEIVQVKRF